jgi:hypothetical protein
VLRRREARTRRPRRAQRVAAALIAALALGGCGLDRARSQPLASVSPPSLDGTARATLDGSQPAGGASGNAATPGFAGAAAAATGATGASGAQQAGAQAGAGAGDDSHDHCVSGEPADASDALLTGAPDDWKASNGDIDLVLPKEVLDWMHTRSWEPSHDAWHNVRRCRGGTMQAPAGFPAAGPMASAICSHTELIPAHQECADAEDGYEFLVMHRHMLQALRRAFPQHAQLFAGFPAFPYQAQDVPAEWRGRWGNGWSQQITDTAAMLEDIEHQLSRFASEGELGKFIQCGTMNSGASSIHGALHFKWVVNDSPYSLGKQSVNIDNYMFWKLHGWIDQIWERYRLAKGAAPDDATLTSALVEQCRQMHALGHAVAAMSPATKTALPIEHGVFHERVRPILEKTCSSCHSETSPEAGLSLGGQISSADIVRALVNVPAMHGGQFARIVPGNAQQSWLYLKASGMAAGAGCSGGACNTQVMPPTGRVTLNDSDLMTIEGWIADGAAAPAP